MFVRKIITVCLVMAGVLLMTNCDPLIDYDHVFRHNRADADNGPPLDDPGSNDPVITITTQPVSETNVTEGEITGSLSVVASVTQGATLSYQWFSNTTNSNVGGTIILGAESASFTILTGLSEGEHFFFAEVRADGAESVRSSVATVNVLPPVGPVAMTMVRIQAGYFTMGDADTQSWNAQPPHTVTLTQGFYMSRHEVTQYQFEDVMGFNPSNFRGPNLPVETVNWYDAIVFSNRLSIRNGLTPAYRIRCITNNEWTTYPDRWGEIPRGIWNDARWDAVEIVANSTGYRLPTEAQWEYAARAGTTTPWNTGYEITIDDANFMFDENWNEIPGALGRTSEVGRFAPNAWGLYDMHGNVWEWVWDWFGSYSSAPQIDPSGASSGTYRVIRGGCWFSVAQNLRSALRGVVNPGSAWLSDLGFRVVRP